MKLLLFLFLPFFASATDYYVSAGGSDGNPGTLAAPWKTTDKVNAASLVSGDVVRFRRGDQFFGYILASKSGVRYATYGAGAQPIITGFTDLTAWTSVGNNMWESSLAKACNIVVINGTNTAMGRTPNIGYYSMTSTGFSSATIGQLTGTENYKGAELIVKTNASWITSRNLITSQVSKTLNTVPNYPNPGGFTIYNFGSQGFIQNALSTLDRQGEWYYNPSTKRLTVYSIGTPSGVRATSIDSLVKITATNITMDSIDFTGANTDAIQALTSGARVTNCNTRYCGDMGIQEGNSATGLTVQGCSIRDCENSGITDVYTGGNNNRLISGNTFTNISMIEGSAGSLDGQNMAVCFQGASATGDLIQSNSIDSCGYIGIFAVGKSFTIYQNVVNHYCFYNTDGAGIYTGNNGTARVIRKNIVLNGMTSAAHGIYVDDNGSNVTIDSNSVYRAINGIYLHNAHEIGVSANTVYNCSSASLSMSHDVNEATRNTTISQNIFVISTSNVNLGNCSYQTSELSETNFGTSDNNYIASPVKSDLNAWFTAQKGTTFNHYSLSQWQAKTGQDAHSKASPKIVPSADSLRFEYNASAGSLQVDLGGVTYIDVAGVAYSGSLTLKPYSSVVLIRTGTGGAIPVPVFKNVAQSKAFIKNNCTSGTGSSVVYGVPAGKYTASTQAGADQLATTDVSNNGQNYANLNGQCMPKTIIKVVIYYSDGSQVIQQ